MLAVGRFVNDQSDVEAEVLQKIENLKEILVEDSLKAPKIFDEVVQLCLEKNAPDQCWRDAVKILSDYISNASIYKRRKLVGAIQRISLTAKILLLREFKKPFETGFSHGAALCRPRRAGRNAEKFSAFAKTPLRRPVAYGRNDSWKLGIGEDDREKIDKLTPIILPQNLTVVDVYISTQHTIFVMSNGDFYGCGLARNFLVDKKGSDEIVKIPVKLDYVSVPESRIRQKPHCNMESDCTNFLNYNDDLVLSVGGVSAPFVPKEETVQSGPNWQIFKGPQLWKRDVFETGFLAIDGIDYFVCSDGTWSELSPSADKHPIVFMVNGRYVDSDQIWKTIFVCRDGSIYAHAKGNLYKGTLVRAPVVNDTGETGGDEDEEEEEVEEGGEGGDEKREMTLVALMEEVVLPFTFGGVATVDNGSSWIFYPIRPSFDARDEFKIKHLPRIESPLLAPKIYLKQEKNKTKTFGSDILTLAMEVFGNKQQFCTLYRNFIDSDEKNNIFCVTGLPTNRVHILSTILALKHYLRINQEFNVPEVILQCGDPENSVEYKRKMKECREEAFEEGRKIKPLVVPASWEDVELRTQQIAAELVKFFVHTTDDIFRSIKVLESLPLKYRNNQRDTKFCDSILSFLNFINNYKSIIEVHSQIIEFSQTTPGIKPIVESQIANGSIDKNDKRFERIRVEAFPTDHSSNHSNHFRQFAMQTHTCAFFINAIDPKLIEFVKHGVLNLNLVCMEDPDKFPKLIDAFFFCLEELDYFDLSKHEIPFPLSISEICKTLPPSEIYTISTSDDKEVKVPSILFELFSSEYDAARRRVARNSGEDELRLKSIASAEAIELFMETMIDPRRFMAIDMELKKEIFDLACLQMCDSFKVGLLRMIVMSVEEDRDLEFVSKLFKLLPDDLIPLVAECRADIVFYWRDEIFGASSGDRILPIIQSLAEQMPLNEYPKYAEPITMTSDSEIEKRQIDKKWLYDQLSNKEQDQDIHWSLTTSIMTWSGYATNRLATKRCNNCGRNPKVAAFQGKLRRFQPLDP